MRTTIVLTALLLSPLAGCAALEDAFSDDPSLIERRLVTQTLEFDSSTVTPPLPPSGPEDLAQRFNVSFDVPAGAQDLEMSAFVRFTTPEGPDGVPQGQVHVNMRLPDDTAYATTRDRTGEVQQTLAMPPPGTWTIDVEASGQGTVEILVTALVPLD